MPPTTTTTTTTVPTTTTPHRTLLLIDLTPFLHPPNRPHSYLTTLLSTAHHLLSTTSSSSLSAFKLFSSSPKLPFYPSHSLSFNLPHHTLSSLSSTLSRLSLSLSASFSVSKPRGSLISTSLAQIIHDYAWDLYPNDDASHKLDFTSLINVRSNLVVVLSPICGSFNDLCDFVGNEGDLFDDCDVICERFRDVFGYVRDAFLCRDIHLTWVDVRLDCESRIDGQSCKLDCGIDGQSCKLDCEFGRVMRVFRDGVKGLGWGFCSSDSIVLGSAIVPFGLVYPMIGVSSDLSCGEKVCGQLSLEILDVSGKPLECKYCDLELVDMKTLRGRGLSEVSLDWESRKDGGQITRVWERCGNGVVKIDVKGVCRRSELANTEEGEVSDVVLVCESLSKDPKKKKSKEASCKEFFADRVLDLLSAETGNSARRKSPPLWQILLSFLYRRGYWAVVSLSNADGSTAMGVLKPYTVDSAFLCVLKNSADSQYGSRFQCGLSGLSLGQCGSEAGDKTRTLDIGIDSVSGIVGNDGRRNHKKQQHRYKDLAWSSFCKAAFERCEMELEEAYFSKGCEASKKLKFLKCWMKQVVKNSSSFPCRSDLPKIQEIHEERVCKSKQESERPVPVLAGEDAVKELPETEEATASLPEAGDAFFNNLSQRIKHGIESGVDLKAFAQRVVSSCIYWLSRKLGPQTNEESQASVERSDGSCCGGLVVRQLIKILLMNPKDVAAKHKDNNLSSEAPDPKPPKSSSEDKIREYELQILIRLEILQSDIASGIRETTKHKFVKHICSLLELIQCGMEDGFFGDFNLNDYVGRTVGSRYKQKLGGVVHKIYEQMDLFLFDDEDESPNLLLNSEESNQSWKIGDNDKGSEPNSTEDSFSGPARDHERCQKERGIANRERRLLEAQERRERALRLSSFTRRAMPELQRVWAPKPPKLSRSKSESFRRSKRKNRRERYDMVCETPMSGAKKCLFPSECSIGDQDCREQGVSSTSATKRALFQNDPFRHDWSP